MSHNWAVDFPVVMPMIALLALAGVMAVFALLSARRVAATNRKLEAEIGKGRRTEQTLRESGDRAKAILETALDAIITMDSEGIIVSFNASAERIFGYRPCDVIGRPLAEVIIHSTVRDEYRSAITDGQAWPGGLGSRVEVLGQRADGSPLEIELDINRIPSDGPSLFAAFLRDIAERKKSDRAMRESQQLLNAVIDNSPALIYVKDLEGRFILVNRGIEELLQLPSAQIVGKTNYDLAPKETADAIRAIDLQVAASGKVVEAEETLALHDGPHTFLSIKFPILTSGKPAMGGICTDITERKKADVAQSRLAAIVESSADAIISRTLDGTVTSWNTGAEKLFGYTAAEMIGSSIESLIPPEIAKDEEEIQDRLRRGDLIERYETTRVRKGGQPVEVSVTMSPLRDLAGNIVGASKIARDISLYKRSEQRLRDQLGRLDLLDRITRSIGQREDLRSVFQVVIRTLEDSLSLDFSCICLYDAASEMLTVTSVGVGSGGLALEFALTEQSRIDIDHNGLIRCVRGELVYEPDISGSEFPFPARLSAAGLHAVVFAPLRSESSVFGVLVTARREADSFSSGDCEFLRQLSEHVALAAQQAQTYDALQQAYDDLRQTQQAVLEHERLRTLGQMASGIAHDINNALSPVALYTQSLLEGEPGLSARTRRYLETTQLAIDDVAETVGRMREFYRQREPQVQLTPVYLNGLIQQVVELTRARWSDMPQLRGTVVRMQTDLAQDLPAVSGIDSEIRQALTNLILNAVDAMPEGGSLTLRTGVEPGVPREGSPCVCVEVQDSGVGMDEETRRRCLEPFFTTKGDRGTGLGLAMVYGVARRHDAELEIESAAGKGTTVRLKIPALTVLPEQPSEQPSPSARTRNVMPRLRILIVDDDPLLIRSLRDALEGDGHDVTTANGGREGVEVFQESVRSGERFAAVITDLGMPHFDGRKVASAVKMACPEMPVILLTGWGQRLVAEDDVPAHVDRVLNKPPKMHLIRTALLELTADSSLVAASGRKV